MDSQSLNSIEFVANVAMFEFESMRIVDIDGIGIQR